MSKAGIANKLQGKKDTVLEYGFSLNKEDG
jgi:hypothetical protein